MEINLYSTYYYSPINALVILIHFLRLVGKEGEALVDAIIIDDDIIRLTTFIFANLDIRSGRTTAVGTNFIRNEIRYTKIFDLIFRHESILGELQ